MPKCEHVIQAQIYICKKQSYCLRFFKNYSHRVNQNSNVAY